MRLLPNKMEPTINTILHTEGIRIAIEEITKLIPVSRSKWSVRNKTHAKDSNWFKSEKMNLGFRILARGGALIKRIVWLSSLPERRRGSHNPLEQRFAERGIVNARPRILGELHKGVDKVLEEEF